MSKILYLIFVKLYPAAVRLVSPLNEKARLWIAGRAAIFDKIGAVIPAGKPLIWMHCASLGEFEQGRPLLAKLRADYPSYKLLLTFFSPSGYEVQKGYKGVDYVFYLPMDSPKNASRFLQLAQPSLAIFIKYEFWHFYIAELKTRKIPLLLVSGIFRSSQPFFSFFGRFYRDMLSGFAHLFVQNEESVQLLQSIGLADTVSLAGDTRFDRVIEIAAHFEPIPLIENFCGNANVIVAGSTWHDDDQQLAQFANMHSSVKFIIAPHDIGKERLQECLRLYKNSVLFSSVGKGVLPPTINTFIIDNIGMLSRLYKYATVAYVGGGFGADGVHNVLEAAVYGKAVVFGPQYEKFFEANELVDSGGAVSVENAVELDQVFTRLLPKGEEYRQHCKVASDYVYSKKGTTEKIMNFIQEKRLLTN